MEKASWGILRKGVTILALLMLAGLGACRKTTPPSPPPPAVTVAHPLQQRITEWNEYPARLAPVESVEVRPRVSGFIESVHFREGQHVREKDLLFVIDQRPYAAEVARAEARLLQARAAQSLARANLERSRQLRSSQAISKEEADIRTSEAMQAEANVAQAEAELSSARLQLDYTEVRTPIAGIVSRRLVTPGNIVQGGTTEGTLLTTVVPHHPIYAYFEADEAAVLAGIRRYFAGRQPGRGEPGHRPIEMQLVDEKGFPWKGEIDFFDNQINPGTSTLEMRGRFENPDNFLTPGMFVRVRVPAGGEREVILVPRDAIVSDLTARFVWVLQPDQTAIRRPVELGNVYGAFRVVESGLSPEDKIIIRGFQFLRPGTKVAAEETTLSEQGETPGA
ncbi:MAG: efflux RND transporter periplasmic adaptor subunit [Terrimicrobiaceae bacterium]|nr:efflux RND transporter periplasmic adaptor subunit [Terrimicrobiaceae bacterium]